MTIELVSPVLQRHVEGFYWKLDEINAGKSSFISGNIVRAAIACGLLVEPNGDVGEMPAGRVTKIAKAISEAIAEATKVPPD
jgi:hypothetical protein